MELMLIFWYLLWGALAVALVTVLWSMVSTAVFFVKRARARSVRARSPEKPPDVVRGAETE